MTVAEHSQNVAEVAKVLLDLIPPSVRELMGGSPVPVAAVHDVGKVSPGFQKRILGQHLAFLCPALQFLDQQGFETAHARTGEAALNAHLGAGNETAGLAAVVGAHHGVRNGAWAATDTGTTLGGEGWATERRGLLEHILQEFGPLAQAPPPDLDALTGLVCVADWIGSDEMFFPPDGLPPGIDRATRARDAVTACGWTPIAVEPGLSFKEIFGFDPYPLQRDFVDTVDGPGLYVLEAPMGLGKTEAALYAAYKLMADGHCLGVYFGLPTRLTSDRIHERVRDPFIKRICRSDTDVRLAHGHAWMRSFSHGGEELGSGGRWFRPSKRALLMPFAVGTIDQALLAVLKVRHHFIRCFGLAGKVVILDEVHSYDVYTGTLLDLLVRRLLELGCSVIILSATLTRARKRTFFADSPTLGPPEPYPLTSAQRRSGALMIASEPPATKRVHVTVRQLSTPQVAELAVEKARSRHCVLCIANTVTQAQLWYREVKATMPEDSFDLALLHSAFPAWRRQELEEKWMAKLGKEGDRTRGCVLVATQVVEQSVDIDADLMITELAPTDMLLQRIGRLWRHEHPDRPCRAPSVTIVVGEVSQVETLGELEEALGKTNCRVYQPYVLWRTYRVWGQRDEVQLPGDIRLLLESTYEDLDDEPAFLDEAKTMLTKRRAKLRSLAQSARADKVGFCTIPDDERAATRYSEIPKIDAVVVRSVDSRSTGVDLVLSSGAEIKVDAFSKNPWASAQLHLNMVSVPAYRLPEVSTPPFMRKHFFERTALLVISADGELMLDGRPTGLRYDVEVGLQQPTAAKKKHAGPGWHDSTIADQDEWEGGLDEFGW
jgi:CRISPR-associated endonuclease/helicase Cas3